MADFNWAFRDSDGNVVHSTQLSEILREWQGKEERWMFVAPHDDDLCLGAGLLILQAVAAGIPVRAVITTDGRMGYGSSIPKEKIVSIRSKETMDSFKILGVEDVQWLGFPDCSLHLFSGCREAKADDPAVVKGQVGLQNSYVAQLRDFRPTRVFVPSGNDYHPDHKMVYQELLISLFHSSGDIWPQLGEPLAKTPICYEMAIYKDFLDPPNHRLKVSDSIFQKKLDSIYAYASQKQIEVLIENTRKTGAQEFYRDVRFELYLPEKYNALFD